MVIKQKIANNSEQIVFQYRNLVKNRSFERYEERLAADLEWGMNEGSKFFEEKSFVQKALKKITSRLQELGIDYAVIGGMALFSHGFRRFTEDVDLLVTRDGLKEIHRQLEGLGYLPPFEGSKNLRDIEYGVRIEFLLTGEYPGDGKPKPVAFPNPAKVTIEKNGVRYINLENLIELKLASGMTSVSRMKDLADVMELIKELNLPLNFSDRVNPFVRDKYSELWQNVNPPMKKYIKIFRNKLKLSTSRSFEELITELKNTNNELKSMLDDGVTFDPERDSIGENIYLMTTDPAVAKKYDMHDESEFWTERDDDSRTIEQN